MDRKHIANALMDYTTADILNTPIRRGGVLPWTEYADRSEVDLSSGLTGTLADAFTAPARAYRGQISEDQMVPEAFNLAGSLALGGFMAPKPTNALGAFGARPPRNGFEMDYFGTPVQIVHNPSQRQLSSLLPKTRYQAARRITDPDTGDVYIWDAADPALHQMVAEKLGLRYDPDFADIIGLD